jgi:hypothetical protein
MAANPHPTMTVSGPATADPDCARMRTWRPMSTAPNPAVMPLPTAANPIKSRIGRHRDYFDLRRGRFGWLDHDDVTAGRRLLDSDRAVAIDDLAFDATGDERQRGGDYNCFDQNRIFHIQLIRRDASGIVSFFC